MAGRDRRSPLNPSRPLRINRLFIYAGLTLFFSWTVFVYAKFYRSLGFPWWYWATGLAGVFGARHFLPTTLKSRLKPGLARLFVGGVVFVFLGTLIAAPWSVVVVTAM